MAAANVHKRPKRRGSQMDAHHFERMIGWVLKKGRGDVDARAVGIAGCCARAASGHAAAPPSSVMNSRRLMPNIGLPPPPVGLPHAQPAAEGPASPWGRPQYSRAPAGSTRAKDLLAHPAKTGVHRVQW